MAETKAHRRISPADIERPGRGDRASFLCGSAACCAMTAALRSIHALSPDGIGLHKEWRVARRGAVSSTPIVGVDLHVVVREVAGVDLSTR